MGVTTGCKEFVRDLPSDFGPVTIRTMFGGAGIYADGVMFAILVDDTVYLKADDASAHAFAAEDKKPFTYRPSGGHRSPCHTGKCLNACWTIRRSRRPGPRRHTGSPERRRARARAKRDRPRQS